MPQALIQQGGGYAAAVLADSPKGFYKLDELSGLPQDSSGNGLHMTANGGPTDQTYRVAGPMTNSYGIRQNGGRNFQRALLSTLTNNFTMELWWMYEAAGGTDTILLNGSRSTDGWGIDSNPPTQFRALYGSVAFEANAALSIVASTWYHIAVVRAAGTTIYYVDGAVDTPNAGTDTPNVPSTNVFQIGSSSQVQGVWSNVAIYESALSAARIAAHYDARTGVSGPDPVRIEPLGWTSTRR